MNGQAAGRAPNFAGALHPQRLPFAARVFATVLIVTSAGCALALLTHTAPGGAGDIAIWTLAALVGQLLIFPTPTGRGEVSLGTGVHLCMALVLPPGVWIPALWLSRGVAAVSFRRKPWTRSLFGAARVSASVLAAAVVMRALEVPTEVDLTSADWPRHMTGFVLGALAYFVVHTTAGSTVVGLGTGRSPWRVWRERDAVSAELLGAVALVLLAPVTALTYQTFGAFGLALYFLPFALLRDSSIRFVALRRTQEALVAAECLAARGSLAAQVGHEINDNLTAAQGQLQLLLRAPGPVTSEELERRVRKVLDPLARIDGLSKGLMDFSRRDTVVEPTRLADLISSTVSLLRCQRRFEGVRFELELERPRGAVWLDPIQIEQALMNLLVNGSEAMEVAGSTTRVITIWTRPAAGDRIEIGVADSGPGVPPAMRTLVFEPGFTTRPAGRGYGLVTVAAIARRHRGRVSVADSPAGGALFVLSLPARHVGIVVPPVERGVPALEMPAALSRAA